jgi:tetratricopeptide (TPR) repeat protein
MVRKETRTLGDAIQAGVRRDYTGAVLILEQLLADPAAPPETYLYLGRALHALGDYERAIAVLNSYIRLRPRNTQGYFFAGRTLLAQGQNNRAVRSLYRAFKLNPRNAQVLTLLGVAHLRSRHSIQAVAVLEQAVETAAALKLPPTEQQRIHRAYINALLIRGIKLCRQGDYEAGIRMLCFVLENNADLPLLRLELCRACRETGRLEAALKHYSRALEFAPRDRRIRWYRAAVLMDLKKRSEAVGEILRLRAGTRPGQPKEPDQPWNSEAVDHYLARSFLEMGEWRRATEICKTMLKRSPSGAVHAMYAQALRNLGDLRAALNHLDRARKITGDRVEYQYERFLCGWEGKDREIMKGAIARLKTLGAGPEIIGGFESRYQETAIPHIADLDK